MTAEKPNLPKLPKGLFFRLRSGPSSYWAWLELRRKRLIGSTLVDKIDAEPSPEDIEEKARMLSKHYRQCQERQACIDKLSGDYK